MTKHAKKNILKELETILRSACHAPKCKGKPSTCPRQCGCRNERDFKLNNETAICWILADEVHRQWNHFGKIWITKDFLSQVNAYIQLSRYHMSEGWRNFFRNTYGILDNIKDMQTWRSTYGHYHTIKEKTNHMRYVVSRLKREPR